MQHGAKNSLSKPPVEILVEALNARENEAGRKVLRNIGVSTEAERAPAIVRQSAFATQCQRIQNEIITMRVLVAHSRTNVALELPVRRHGPGLR